MNNPYNDLWVIHQVTVSSLSRWVVPYPTGCFPVAFRRLAFASVTFPVLLRNCDFLTKARLSADRPHEGCHVSPSRDTDGVGILCTPGSGVRDTSWTTLVSLTHYRRLDYPSFRRLAVTTLVRIHVCLPVHPSPCPVEPDG